MSGRTWGRLASGAAILAVAAVAGIISYQHIEELSLSLHQSLLTARLMPVGIDGLITVGSVVLLQSGSRLGWLGIGPGAALSLFANAESALRFGWLAAVWAAVPSVSFMLATFILERWLAAQVDAPAQATIPTAIGPTGAVSAGTDADVAVDVPEDVPADVPASRQYPARVPRQRAVSEARGARASGRRQKSPERVFATEIEAGTVPSLRQVKDRMHVGTDRARIIRDELAQIMEEAQPEAA